VFFSITPRSKDLLAKCEVQTCSSVTVKDLKAKVGFVSQQTKFVELVNSPTSSAKPPSLYKCCTSSRGLLIVERLDVVLRTLDCPTVSASVSFMPLLCSFELPPRSIQLLASFSP
jgi:hypothetical protein